MKLSASAGALAILAASWGTAAAGLTLAEAASPAETPPSSYANDVYVDSRGCVYVRANIGSTVNWVPRLSRDRETVVCGMTPTGAAARLTAPRPPRPPQAAAVVATAPAATPIPAQVITTPSVPVQVQVRVARSGATRIPAGYRAAWDDDRLNPHRGPRTAYGDAQMATVLDTDTVPMQPSDNRTAGDVIVAPSEPAAAARVAPPMAPGARYVQVGAYRQAGNAQNALARIHGLGMKAATARTGSGLTLVMAGPFANPAELQRALATLRGYYPDAYPHG